MRRGEQGRNAHEPDIVTPSNWWFELEDGDAKGPLRKHLQAMRDLELHRRRGGERYKRAVAICHAKGARHTTATLTLWHLWATVCGDESGIEPDVGDDFFTLPVTIDYQEFLRVLEYEQRTGGDSYGTGERGTSG